MTKAEKISHSSDMIRAAIDSLHLLLKGRYGHLDRLHDAADAGGYIAPGTTEEIRLHADALKLSDLSDELLRCRAELLANQPVELTRAS